MRGFLVFVVLLALFGAGLALARSGDGLGIILIMLALMIGWYGERSRNWRIVLRSTKKAVRDYRRSKWGAYGRLAIVVTVLVFVVYSAAFRREG